MLVTVKSAKDLPAADSNGLSDPYAKVKIGEESRKTTIQYDTLSPSWNEKFEFIKVSKGLSSAARKSFVTCCTAQQVIECSAPLSALWSSTAEKS